LFFSTCALEFTCGTWGATFLVENGSLPEAVASQYLTYYYLGITASRFISGLISTKIPAKSIVLSGCGIAGVGVTLLLLPIPATIKGFGLLIIGFGNGTTFPNLSYLTPTYFGKDISQSIMGTIMVACNLGICLMPPLFGLLAEYVGIWLFPYFLVLCFVAMLFTEIIYIKMPKQKSSDIKF
jgi:fucose permease